VFCISAAILISDRPAPGVSQLWAEPSSGDKAASAGSGATVELTGYTAKEALKSSKFYVMFIAVLILNTATVIGINSLGLFATVSVDFSVAAIGTLYMLFSLANLAGTASAGIVSDKIGPKPAMVIACLAIIVGYLFELFIGSLGSFFMYICPIMMGWGISWLFVPTQILVRQVFGMKAYGTILGYILIAVSAGGSLFPLYQGIYDANQSFTPGLIGMLVLVVIATITMAMFKVKSDKVAVN